MFRRLLACLVALAIALPSVGVGAASFVVGMTAKARQAAADCECPPGKSDCTDMDRACDCGLVCVARVAAADPAVSTTTPPPVSVALTGVRLMTRSAPPSSAPPDTPFRPPRLSIPS